MAAVAALMNPLKSVEARLLVGEKRMVELRGPLAALQRIENAVNVELNS